MWISKCNIVRNCLWNWLSNYNISIHVLFTIIIRLEKVWSILSYWWFRLVLMVIRFIRLYKMAFIFLCFLKFFIEVKRRKYNYWGCRLLSCKTTFLSREQNHVMLIYRYSDDLALFPHSNEGIIVVIWRFIVYIRALIIHPVWLHYVILYCNS